MDPNMDFNNMQFSKLENHNQIPENYSEEDLEFNQQLRMNNKPKIPMSYYFSQTQQDNFQKPFNKYEEMNQMGKMNQGYEEINYNRLGMKNLNMSNINNMNINIINHIPMKNPSPQMNYMHNNDSGETDELINNFSNLNIKKDSMGGMNYQNIQNLQNMQQLNNPPVKKDLAYNYYFGAQGGKQMPNPDESYTYYEPQEEEAPELDPRMLMQNQNSHFQNNFQNQNKNYKYKNQNNMGGNMGNMKMPNPNFQQNMQNFQTPQNYNYQPQHNKYYGNNRQNNNNNNSNDNSNYTPNPNFKNSSNQNRNKYNNKNNQVLNQGENKYNNLQMNIQPQGNESNFIPGRYFVIKSVDEDNIHKSIKYRIWCSTIKGNQKLQKAFKEADNKYPIYLFYSVNGSGRFLGLAQMTSEVEYRANFNYWTQNEKWKGFFFLVWLAIKDIPNRVFRNIFNEYNENKPVTASRDTQEIQPLAGAEMLKIFSEYAYESSILDDFKFYEQKQETMSDLPIPQKGNNFNNIPKNMNYNQIPDNEDAPPEENFNNQNFSSQNIYDNNYKNFVMQQQQLGMQNQQNAPKRIIKRINSTENILNSNKEHNSEDENN